ncbi:aromatic acid exporter family protein [Bacillus solitudinis]|uniref:aromatic acid exporter family protein n=1 Tax=Bacillus solitudinis TaxID=2014074 RepID=UPI000C23BAA9|nr:aromatic acid exporter family protein [Bacillus solitudinis]
MNFRIGYRTIKTALGAAIAIAIAHGMQLEFYSAAAIITILCISVTRRQSLLISWHRIIACLVAMVFSFVLFEALGYNPLTLALLLLLFIPTSVKLKVTEGIVTSCVIILHIYVIGQVSLAILLNELLLICVGVGVALVMNLYMPSHEKKLRYFRREIEEHFKSIFNEMSTYIRHGESIWDGKEIPETLALLKQGKDIALTNIHNHILRYEDQYYHYFKMREKQFEIIERLMPFVSSINRSVPQGITIADFLDELSKSISPTNHVPYFLDRLNDMKRDFQEMPLPETREEFELRSSLFYIMHELEQYLFIKDRLWNDVDKRMV